MPVLLPICDAAGRGPVQCSLIQIQSHVGIRTFSSVASVDEGINLFHNVTVIVSWESLQYWNTNFAKLLPPLHLRHLRKVQGQTYTYMLMMRNCLGIYYTASTSFVKLCSTRTASGAKRSICWLRVRNYFIPVRHKGLSKPVADERLIWLDTYQY